MTELIVKPIVAMMIILSIESAIVGPGAEGFNESIIPGNVKINAKIPRVKANLSPRLSFELQ